MKSKVVMGIVVGFLLMGSNLLAADGDLIVNGNVGIGNTSPVTRLFVQESGDNTAVTVWTPGSSNTSSFKVVMPLSTGINNGKALAFTALNGNVEEDYARTMFYTDGSFGVGNGQGPRDTYLRRYSASNFMIDSDKAGGPANLLVMGNIGIGVTDTSGWKLLVNGPAYSTGGWQASDLRFKENLEPIESPLSKVLRMEGVVFNWRVKEYEGRGFPAGKHYGVVAQKVEEVLPEVVRERSDGEKAVAYAEIIPVLIEAIKEQQKEIERLRFLVELRAKE